MSSKVSCIAYGPVKAESATASMPTKLERFGALLGSEKILGRFKQVVEKGDLAEANVAMSQLWKTANSRWSTGKAKSSASLKMAELCREKAPKALYFVACGYTGAGAREMLLAVDALRSIAKSNEDAFNLLFNVSVFTRFPEVALKATEFFTQDARMTPLLVNIVLNRPRVTKDLEDAAVKAAFQRVCQVGSPDDIIMVSGYAEQVISNMKRHHDAERSAAKQYGGALPIQ